MTFKCEYKVKAICEYKSEDDYDKCNGRRIKRIKGGIVL